MEAEVIISCPASGPCPVLTEPCVMALIVPEASSLTGMAEWLGGGRNFLDFCLKTKRVSLWTRPEVTETESEK